jgi:methionyl aminopeptidase
VPAFLTSPTGPSAHTASVDVNPPKSAAATGLLPGLLEGQGENTDDDDAANEAGADLKLNNQPNSREYAERNS